MIDKLTKHHPTHKTEVSGLNLSVGNGFTGLGFRHNQYQGSIDPIIMVDHYTMTKPTFGVHPHAGLSAVSLLFEDSIGNFHNRDSLGNDFDIRPGDLYLLNSGFGAVHEESPRDGAKIHGLQIFVNLPRILKHKRPSSLYVKKERMPIIEGEGFRVKLALGESNGQQGINSSVWPFNILDGFVNNTSNFGHQVVEYFNSWLYCVEGGIEFCVDSKWFSLEQGDSVALNELNGAEIKVKGVTDISSHFVLLSGKAINEEFVQQGPFVMNTENEIDDVIERYQQGELGVL